MIARLLIIFIFSVVAGPVAPAAAQERVTVGVERLASNGALFLAAIQGYFKAEGLDVDLLEYREPRLIAEAVAAGKADFGLTALTAGGVQSRRPRCDQGGRRAGARDARLRRQ